MLNWNLNRPQSIQWQRWPLSKGVKGGLDNIQSWFFCWCARAGPDRLVHWCGPLVIHVPAADRDCDNDYAKVISEKKTEPLLIARGCTQ